MGTCDHRRPPIVKTCRLLTIFMKGVTWLVFSRHAVRNGEFKQKIIRNSEDLVQKHKNPSANWDSTVWALVKSSDWKIIVWVCGVTAAGTVNESQLSDGRPVIRKWCRIVQLSRIKLLWNNFNGDPHDDNVSQGRGEILCSEPSNLPQTKYIWLKWRHSVSLRFIRRERWKWYNKWVFFNSFQFDHYKWFLLANIFHFSSF